MADRIQADPRDDFGKGAARKLRAVGKIPAVIYGHGSDPQHVSLPGHEMSLLLRKANAVLELELPGGTALALVKDVQRDPVRQIIEHLDLILVRSGERVSVEIPIRVEGEPAAGTVVSLDISTLNLEVEATHIPEGVIVDVTDAPDGTHIIASQLTLPAGAVLLTDADALILTVGGTSGGDVEADDAAAAAEAAAENE